MKEQLDAQAMQLNSMLVEKGELQRQIVELKTLLERVQARQRASLYSRGVSQVPQTADSHTCTTPTQLVTPRATPRSFIGASSKQTPVILDGVREASSPAASVHSGVGIARSPRSPRSPVIPSHGVVASGQQTPDLRKSPGAQSPEV